MKNCEEIRVLMSVYLDGELAPEETEFLQKHIDECDECGEYLDGLQDVVSKVRLIPEVKLPDNFHAEAMHKLKDRLNPVEFLTPKEIKKEKNKKAAEKKRGMDTRVWLKSGVVIALIIGCMFAVGQFGDLYINRNEIANDYVNSSSAAENHIQNDEMLLMNETTPESTSGLGTSYDSDHTTSPYGSSFGASNVTGEVFVRQYSIILNVEDYDIALDLIETLPGVTAGMSANYGMVKSANVTRNVDQANYMFSKEFLRSLGEIIDESESEYRVSNELLSLEAQLIAKEEEVARLLSILEKSSTLTNLTTVERRISEAENERDNIKSQILRYNSEVNNCVLNIIVNYNEPNIYITPISNKTYTERLKEYFDKSIEFLVNVFENITIFMAMISAPVILALILFVIIFTILRRKGGKHEKHDE